jgi:hypothetical protein
LVLWYYDDLCGVIGTGYCLVLKISLEMPFLKIRFGDGCLSVLVLSWLRNAEVLSPTKFPRFAPPFEGGTRRLSVEKIP